MTKKEGLTKMDQILQNLEQNYTELEAMYKAVSHPVTADVQAEAVRIMRASISVTCMALNFKEMPAEVKRPFASLLYSVADAF